MTSISFNTKWTNIKYCNLFFFGRGGGLTEWNIMNKEKCSIKRCAFRCFTQNHDLVTDVNSSCYWLFFTHFLKYWSIALISDTWNILLLFPLLGSREYNTKLRHLLSITHQLLNVSFSFSSVFHKLYFKFSIISVCLYYFSNYQLFS